MLQLPLGYVSFTSICVMKFILFVKFHFIYPEKSEDDIEREARLVEQWVSLTEERNAVLVPAPGSGIPGAPADW